MKVKIGNWPTYIGPYQIVQGLFFWTKTEGRFGRPVYPDWVDKISGWLATNRDGSDSWIAKLCGWIDSKRKRTLKVRIDDHDLWDGPRHMALIILPMLERLQKNKHGAPYVDDEDVPPGLRSTAAPKPEKEYDVDANHFKRYDYILNEMIFAFRLETVESWEDQCYDGVDDCELVFTKNEDGTSSGKLVCGPNHTRTWNQVRFDRINSRRLNGLRLFGKYFSTLVD